MLHFITQIKKWATKLKLNLVALYYATQSKETPIRVKYFSILVLAYALSPIDLIPDFNPVLGYIDDLLLVPLGIWLAIKWIPKPLWQDFQNQAIVFTHQKLPASKLGLWLVFGIWALVIVMTYDFWIELFR